MRRNCPKVLRSCRTKVHDVGGGVVAHDLEAPLLVDHQVETVADLNRAHLHRANVEAVRALLLHVGDRDLKLAALVR